ncbi:MAG: hypothetical protein ACHQJ4_07875, partial [Ignavibacteria bacterium]
YLRRGKKFYYIFRKKKFIFKNNVLAPNSSWRNRGLGTDNLIFSTYFILNNLLYITTTQWGAIRPRRKESECQILALVGGLQSDCKQTRFQMNAVLDDG